MNTLIDAVRGQARDKPDALAFWTPTRSWSFAQLEEAANRAAQGLRALGIGEGERVACLTKHTAECVVLTLAACKVGAVCMPVNWRLAPPEIEYIVNHGRARLMVSRESAHRCFGGLPTTCWFCSGERRQPAGLDTGPFIYRLNCPHFAACSIMDLGNRLAF